MSEFDKEAERKRLREKYESEQEDRETTERMSQLLLQGATMTNRHCDDCSSPIFRYQGQEFCPTCQAEAQQAAQSGDEQAGDAKQAPADQQTPQSESTQNNQTDPTQPPQPETTQAPAPRQETTPVVPEGDAADIGDAAEALASTIATLAARAEQTDDPRRAREFLEAAREAADTLTTLTGIAHEFDTLARTPGEERVRGRRACSRRISRSFCPVSRFDDRWTPSISRPPRVRKTDHLTPPSSRQIGACSNTTTPQELIRRGRLSRYAHPGSHRWVGVEFPGAPVRCTDGA